MLIQHDGVPYQQLLARLARSRDVRVYLEIGVNKGVNFRQIPCDVAIGVDPKFELSENVAAEKRRVHLLQTGSDDFFASGELPALAPRGVDMAFLDGLHVFEFLLRDFYNTERYCRRNSLIAMHDCLPVNAEMAERSHRKAERQEKDYADWWTGDVWKIIPILRKLRPDLKLKAVKAPPTGLLFVTGLDPNSRLLEERYLDIVAEFRGLENTDANIRAAYDSIEFVDSQSLTGVDHTLHFAL